MLGDWSGDGHEQTEEFIIKSNLSLIEFEQSLKAGEEIVGINFKDECSEYEMNELSVAGHSALSTALPEFKDKTCWIHSETFLDMMLKVAQIGNPNFEYEIMEFPTLMGLGYGLFGM